MAEISVYMCGKVCNREHRYAFLHEPMCKLDGTTRGVCIDIMERYFFGCGRETVIPV